MALPKAGDTYQLNEDSGVDAQVKAGTVVTLREVVRASTKGAHDARFPQPRQAGVVRTELSAGLGEWPVASFGGATADVDGIRARVLDLAALIEDK